MQRITAESKHYANITKFTVPQTSGFFARYNIQLPVLT